MDRIPRQKNQYGNTISEQHYKPIGLTDKYRTFHSTATEYMFSPSTNRIFSRIDTSGHKTTIIKSKVEIIANFFFLIAMVWNYKSITEGKLEN